MSEPTKDCPTCKHTRGAQCLSPQYLSMSDEERREFWRETDPPCPLWEGEINPKRSGPQGPAAVSC